MARRSNKARRHPKARTQGILELTPRGFGFVKTAEGEFFIPPSKINGAFPGDLVEVSRISSDKAIHNEFGHSQRKPSARVSKVLMRSMETVIGRYEVAEPFGVVVPEDPTIPYDIFTLRKDAPHVHDGDIVEVCIHEYPSRNTAATGSVLRVLGGEDEVDIAIDLIIADHKLETEFSADALEEAEAAVLDVNAALAQGYRDLRSDYVFTVDPVDARDFDDAVSVERTQEGVRLGVHIADVSRYVAFNTALDHNARRRATSVYLVDRVLPMLPERISNNLCSLVPGQDRLAMSVVVDLSPAGRVLHFEVFNSVIRSNARLSYDQAQALIQSHSPEAALSAFRLCDTPQGSLPLAETEVARLAEKVRMLDGLAKTLFGLRLDAGAMDFERTEAKVRLDEERKPLEITYRRRTSATQMIEESMILANHLVAQFLVDKGLPCVFRVHESPDGEALYALYQILQEDSLFKDVDAQLFCDGNPATLQDVLARVKGLPQEELVNSLLLRAMKRAVYRTELDGHFGLALDTYCHFTSPIRRYPDLLVHRMLKEQLFGHTETYVAQKNSMPWMAEHSSEMEREADKAARDSQLVKIVEYLERDIGKTFKGIVANVSTFGVTVRLECTATGMVSLDNLGDEYFSFDPARYVLTGEDTGRVYRLGQPLSVVLTGAYPRERKLTFKLASKKL